MKRNLLATFQSNLKDFVFVIDMPYVFCFFIFKLIFQRHIAER